ncbi:NADP-dependent oxidoreductase [Flavobacterium silvaticum]|uniref:NADP-dependent oxidoreductase n=1 Tax=Flavobacterium silvaticum TaxID=1852020 RepID=A0A972FV52_9FLAO|nr:NADP-dependent oxidoreductase [Flavobacterium silvaticum]NMH28190.1 NADP-dependent oxidoreductase [Flavobacterium silvaticum]
MKAYLLNEPGDASALKLTEISTPEIAPNEVLVKTKAISINPVDAKSRAGKGVYGRIKGQSPLILGWDIAGIVEKVGSDVTKFKSGDHVFGMVNFPGHGKAYAEFVAAPQDQLAIIPDNTSFEQAAAATLAALTAYQILASRIKPGNKVLIQASAGGVGHYAVQIAKSLGAEVTGITSTPNAEFVKSLGADYVIDYKKQNWQDARGFDFSLDTLSGEPLKQMLDTVKDGGILWTLPSGADLTEVREAAAKRNVELGFSMVESNGTDMKAIADLLQSGKLKSEVSQTFDLPELPKAHEAIETGRTRGKIVVTL